MDSITQDTELKKLRDVYLYIIDTFSDLCKSRNIDWYLWAGTLLGAVRHGGFIPWDDDVDVCVSEDDMNILMQNTPKGFSLTKFRNEHYVFSLDNTVMMNISDGAWLSRLKNGLPVGIHIDVFPIYETDKKNSNGEELIVVGYGHYYMPKNYFSNYKLVKFEDRLYPISVNSEEILKKVYGNYKTPNKYFGGHKQFIDYINDQEIYASCLLEVPKGAKFKANFLDIMVSCNPKIELPGDIPHRGIIRGLHSHGNGKLSLTDLIDYTGLKDIRLVEIGSYAGEGTRIFAENDNIKEIHAVQSYKPWFDNRSVTASSNLQNAKKEIQEIKEKYPNKIIIFDGKFPDFLKSGICFTPDIIYIDEQFREIEKIITLALRTGVRYIAGHDYTSYWHEVKNAVDNLLGGPDEVYEDTSWIKDVSNIPNYRKDK